MLRMTCSVGALLFCSVSTASAQLRPVWDLGGGVASGRGTGLGVAAQAGMELRSPSSPFALRFDGSFHQFGQGGRPLGGGGIQPLGNSVRASAATANVVFRLATGSIRPYVLGGAGAYALQGYGLNTGWTAGGGLEVQRGRYQFFGEVRGHFINSSVSHRLSPLVIGIRF